MKKQFWIDSALATIFIFCIMWVIFNVTQFKIFDAFDPIGEALDDMDITDIAFSNLREDPLPDTNIVVVNIGYLSRAQLAHEISIINKYDPKIVGVDVFFDGLKADTLGDVLLSRVLGEVDSLVLVSELLQTAQLAMEHPGDEHFDSLHISHEIFNSNAHYGFSNLFTDAETQEDFKTCRAFPPQRKVRKEREESFAVKIAQLYSPQKASKFLKRDNSLEVINYRGNIIDPFTTTDYPNRFYALDVEDVLNEKFEPGLIKDKIVLLGYMGEDFFDTSWDDKFFTPLNKKYAGKANPDMYGVVVHANIISMILNEDYVNQLNDKKGLGIVLAILICFVNVVLFSYIYYRLPDWYDGITKTIQLLEIAFILFVSVILFSVYSFKLNLVITLAAIALAGDALEVYYGVVKNIFNKEKRKQLFTIKRKAV
ncbi:CHASE2 domain-containing protein [Fulvivirga sediminis]|uniref:CHASE2 domain-containing protein n=1 Tax=Fulvivirga sediminis TaxID=2803949 RepID=A0A937JZD4_9BACT|nr:CHASE2 domain-containing protein [Fulvivirga sediminis]MBL3655076.1 CHASE2 domain-containing protein [Fulvivirga sediminis]